MRAMLGDICANSDAEISSDKQTFNLTGSDDAVKAALEVMSDIKFIVQSQYQIRVKIELASEHKEFVSGKKNGKINKIMGASMLSPRWSRRRHRDFFTDTGFQAMSRSSSTDSTNTTSTLM